MYLLLVFPLCVDPGRNTLPSFYEGLTPGGLTRVMRKHTSYIYAHEQRHITNHLREIQKFIISINLDINQNNQNII